MKETKESTKPNPRFKNYTRVFENLIKSTNVMTANPIVSVIITYDSSRAITITKTHNHKYNIKQYCLESYKMTFEEVVGGDERKDYIKLKEVE